MKNKKPTKEELKKLSSKEYWLKRFNYDNAWKWMFLWAYCPNIFNEKAAKQ